MALKKTIKTDTGVDGQYIRISNVSDTNIDYEVWVTESVRKTTGKIPLGYGSISISDNSIFSEDNLKKEGNTYKTVAYGFLKTTSLFKDALDV